MAQLELDPNVKGKDAGTLRGIEERFNRFQNKNTFWRHSENGTMAEFDAKYESAVKALRARLGKTHPLVIDGREIAKDSTFTVRSPADRDLVLGHFAAGSKEDVRKAVTAAKAAQPAWERIPWQDRAAILEKAGDLFVEHFYELCATMTFETGKSRFEASIDVDEAIDFLRFYAFTMREMNGFEMTMGKPFPNETCTSVRRPWGVFAVICPFNFPVAITTGMTVAALVTGNTAIMKPSPKGALAGKLCYDLLREAGVPGGALQFITGTNQDVSVELLENPDIDGIVFTGSKKVGFHVMRAVAEKGKIKPVIAEMGGKNAVLISDQADLDKAVQGVFRSAFGFSGQKCSACSRVYVHKNVAAEFKERLAALAGAAQVGLPWKKETFMGPVIDSSKLELLRDLVQQVKADGGQVLAGGSPVDEDVEGVALKGNYLQPTIVADLPLDHRVFREEFFMPFVAIAEVESFEAAIAEYNKVEYGLTAGCFTEDDQEARRFFDTIQAGVCYRNRAAGGSTAAVVNGQSFVGWKNSGSTGHGAGGRYYLLQFTKEQSRTVCA